MGKQKKQKKKKKKTRQEKEKNRERDREQEATRKTFFLSLILIQHFGCKNLQKNDLKKALNIMMHANILKEHAKNTNTSIILANNALMFDILDLNAH